MPLGPLLESGVSVIDRADTERRKMEVNSQTFRQSCEEYSQRYQLTKDNIDESDWRKMSDKQWDKMLEGMDDYIDDFKDNLKRLKEVQEEAVDKAVANASSDTKAIAAASAALMAAANGFAGISGTQESADETNSWTYDMQTDDQTILARAKQANEKAADALTKEQELLLTGSTTPGIKGYTNLNNDGEDETLTEVASTESTSKSSEVDDDDDEHTTWYITAFTEQGISCVEYKDGVNKLIWSINYNKSGDYEKVMKFLDKFDKDVDVKFAHDKNFWEDFLADKIDENAVLREYNVK